MAEISEVLGIRLKHTKCRNFWYHEYMTVERYGWRRENQDAHKIIKNVMREKLLYYSVVDFQVALDLGVNRVNSTTPEDSLPPFANILPNSVITNPKFGFVYLNSRSEKKIFIGIESQKYSTQTLLYLQEEIRKHRGTPLVNPEAVDQILENIDVTLNFRNICAFYNRELKKEGGFGTRINDFPDAKI
ncbi:hypothetical protein L6452_30871 [Arctium lappa]|uniref:Uncharacterized protein n=1 Tax=Arctium lappa TaxID=4217 RepID=A0ACB8ZJ88_ARCLA|nr:hypothetical protein L6452_30871 [Arctium lappa]